MKGVMEWLREGVVDGVVEGVVDGVVEGGVCGCGGVTVGGLFEGYGDMC